MSRIFEKFIVLKNADAEKYLTDEEFKALRKLQKKILTGRMSDGKMQNNTYYVVNTDEPYAKQVRDLILKGEIDERNQR